MYLDVLEKINRGISKPTNIMYKCNLSWRPLKEILRLLIEKDLIKEIEKDNHKHYTITKKGKEILTYLETLIRMLHPMREEASVSSERDDFMITMQRNHIKPSLLPDPRKWNRRE